MNHPFPHDIFLAGPPDKHSPLPYRQAIKEAFADLDIYDWEQYKGPDYQKRNHLALQNSAMLVAMAPDFPLPAVGPEIGYFYARHQERIERSRTGLFLGTKTVAGRLLEDWAKPFDHIVIIWPESVKPDFAKRTLAQYGKIVATVEEAIGLIDQLPLHYERINCLAEFYAEPDFAELQEVFDYCEELRRNLTIPDIDTMASQDWIDRNLESWERPPESKQEHKL